MTDTWVLFPILLFLGLYLLMLLALVVGGLRSLRGVSPERGTERQTKWLPGFGGWAENCWTCASKFWFQLEPKEPAESQDLTVSPELSAQPQVSASGFSCFLQRGNLVSKFCEIIPGTPAALEPVLQKLLSVVKTLPCAPDEIDDVELAAREALANAILHGNRGEPTKKVVVACFCECEADGGLLLVVRDEGMGFDPREVPDPTTAERIYSTHGRGIVLMRQLMDEVSFCNGGSEVDLRKRRKPAAEPVNSKAAAMPG